MFENEGSEIENESGVESTASPEPQSDAQPELSEGQEAKQAASQQQKEVPFHEHPRWKEVMEERNAERQARAQLEGRIAEMQRQFAEERKPKSSTPDFNEVRAKMGERLKGIDPEFQAYLSQLEDQALSSKQELAAFREEQFVNRAVGRFDELNKTNSVPKELEGVYRAQLDAIYREGKIRSMDDLEKAYKGIHEPINKLLADREKAYLEKYTATKKAAASTPAAQPKGRTATPGQVPRTFANDQQRKAAMVKDVVTQLRASKDL